MPDQELLEMIAHGSDYLPEALAAAQVELERRDVQPHIAAQVLSALEEESVAARQRARCPLPMRWRIISVLLPFGFIQSMIADRYRAKGFDRCYWEFFLWRRRSLIFWAITFATILTLNFLWPLGNREWIGWLIEVIALVIVLRIPVVDSNDAADSRPAANSNA